MERRCSRWGWACFWFNSSAIDSEHVSSVIPFEVAVVRVVSSTTSSVCCWRGVFSFPLGFRGGGERPTPPEGKDGVEWATTVVEEGEEDKGVVAQWDVGVGRVGTTVEEVVFVVLENTSARQRLLGGVAGVVGGG